MTSDPTPRRRLRGHALADEGAPFDDASERVVDGTWATIAGPGRALCSCGELSPRLPSSTARKAWHREHKTAQRAVLAAGDDA